MAQRIFIASKEPLNFFVRKLNFAPWLVVAEFIDPVQELQPALKWG
jgi:hypothetical protein